MIALKSMLLLAILCPVSAFADSAFYIVAQDSRKCLTAPKDESGSLVMQQECGDTDASKWHWKNYGEHRFLVNQWSGKCLMVLRPSSPPDQLLYFDKLRSGVAAVSDCIDDNDYFWTTAKMGQYYFVSLARTKDQFLNIFFNRKGNGAAVGIMVFINTRFLTGEKGTGFFFVPVEESEKKAYWERLMEELTWMENWIQGLTKPLRSERRRLREVQGDILWISKQQKPIISP